MKQVIVEGRCPKCKNEQLLKITEHKRLCGLCGKTHRVNDDGRYINHMDKVCSSKEV